MDDTNGAPGLVVSTVKVWNDDQALESVPSEAIARHLYEPWASAVPGVHVAVAPDATDTDLPDCSAAVPSDFHSSKLSVTVLPSASVDLADSVGLVLLVAAPVNGDRAVGVPGLVLYCTVSDGSEVGSWEPST